MADAYAGADLVVMPSTWEGFGNPVLESATHRRPLALTPYPVSREITSFGFTFFDIHDVAGIDGFLRSPDESLYESNLEVAREHFNLAGLPAILDDVLTRFCSAGDD
jgi:glycosyltransferase involved in cell wall biosynthesis